MPNSHRYGLRFSRSLSGGGEVPQVLRFPISDDYQASTIVGAGTSVNLNVGDPVKLKADGCVALVQAGEDDSGANADSDDYIFGVIAGFERTKSSNGDIEQRSFQAGAVSYDGGIGGDNAPIALVIPAAGNVFEIDASAVLGTPTKSGALAQVGQTKSFVYSVITSGVVGAPKANPLLDMTTLAETVQGQLVIVGIGSKGDAMDFTATNVTFEVMATALQLAQRGPAADFGATSEH